MTCFSTCPPCPGCEELRRRAEAADRALAAAANSLEWISNRRSDGHEELVDVLGEIRAYAHSRSIVARAALKGSQR